MNSGGDKTFVMSHAQTFDTAWCPDAVPFEEIIAN